jgi:uncharacterized alkaline shock family protein YloU
MSDQSLAADLEKVVAGVDGVGRLYGAPPAIGEAATMARDLVTTGGVTLPPRIRLADDDVVTVSIATEHGRPAPEVARAVHDAVETFMTSRGLPLARVEVRIAHID